MSIINLLISPLGVGGPVVADLTIFDLDRPPVAVDHQLVQGGVEPLHFDRSQINLRRR